MKVHGVKREWNSPVFFSKKHLCPACKTQLKKIKTETIVNSSSEEAKHYDFSNGDGFLSGNIKFIRTAFRCIECDRIYSIKELKKTESAKKNCK